MSSSTNTLLSFLIALLGVFTQHVVAQTELFQGYGVSITPATDSTNPVNATFGQSNFFSYGTPNGYLSFGWFLRPNIKTHTAKCVPDTDKYEWFEYANGQCGYTECRVHVLNYPNVKKPTVPSFEGNYVSRFLSAGKSPAAKLALSYFDEDNGNYAVGTRDLLTAVPGVPRDAATVKKCNKAFATLERLQAKRQLPIHFELTNPC